MIQTKGQPQQGESPERVLTWTLGLLGLTMLWIALAFLPAGSHLAEVLGFAYAPHVFKEQGITALAAGAALMAGAFRTQYRAGAVILAVPLGLLQGINALVDLPHLTRPLAELIHGFQAALAVSAGIAWWRSRDHG